MAAGKRYKFQGSTIAVLTDFEPGSPAITITTITQANPAVVTAGTHGLIEGDVIRITGVVGMTEVNDQVYVVGPVTATTFELVDVDSTGYNAYVSGGTVEKGALSNFCELTGYNYQSGSSPEISATSLCSVAQEFELGLADFGTTQLDYNFAPESAIQTALHDAFITKEEVAVYVKLPNDGGEMVQMGFVQQESATGAVNGMWTGSTTIRNTGQRVDIA